MPRSTRRRQPRRRPPPRPTYRGAPVDEAPVERTPSASGRASGPAQYIARQTPYLVGELRRVALASAACFGLLGLLILVDRLQ